MSWNLGSLGPRGRQQKIILTSEFEPARDFVVMQKSKCNMLGCKSKQWIEQLPAYITEGHVQAILGMFTNMITKGNTLLEAKADAHKLLNKL